MANPHRGSVAFQVGDRALTLRFSVNALCELEDLLGEPVAKIAAKLEDAENIKLSMVRAIVWAGLRDYHAEVSLAAAGEIVDEAGIPDAMEKVGKALALAFPKPERGGARPRAAAKT